MIDLDELERLLDKAEWPKYDGQDGAVLRTLIQRVREAEARAVPIEPGDVELYGGDPYHSARSWHDEAMRLQRDTEILRDALKVVETTLTGADDDTERLSPGIELGMLGVVRFALDATGKDAYK